TDDATRARLVAQAASRRPDWDAVADRVAAAYEQVLTRPLPARRRRPLVAVVTPLPPAPSGVAAYSYRLLGAVRQHCDVHAFADGDRWFDGGVVPDGEPRAPEGVPVSTARLLHAWDAAHGGYDCVVYCVGNSEYHLGALAALRRRPGVVLAHDV